MRIISGKQKGKIIRAPESLPVRPTTDMAKEGLFNMLTHRIPLDGIRVLDLFSGTGNITYEFLSRGAESVVSVDKNEQCVRFIRKTLASMGYDNSRVYKADYKIALERATGPFDILFADPPYDAGLYADLIERVAKSGLIGEETIFVLEHPMEAMADFPVDPIDVRHYGKVYFSIFK